jgi:hypothetical protein
MNLGLHPNNSQRPIGGRVRPQRCHLNAPVDQARDNANDLREVYLPDDLAVKYPDAARDFIWQYLFPASKRAVDPRSQIVRRHHLDPSALQRAVRDAAQKASSPARRPRRAFPARWVV